MSGTHAAGAAQENAAAGILRFRARDLFSREAKGPTLGKRKPESSRGWHSCPPHRAPGGRNLATEQPPRTQIPRPLLWGAAQAMGFSQLPTRLSQVFGWGRGWPPQQRDEGGESFCRNFSWGSFSSPSPQMSMAACLTGTPPKPCRWGQLSPSYREDSRAQKGEELAQSH